MTKTRLVVESLVIWHSFDIRHSDFVICPPFFT